MESNEMIKTFVDGVEVEGVITYRSEFDIDVKITKPFKNITGGSHIPHFMAPHNSFIGEYGDKRGVEILEELYSIGIFINQNMENLQKKYIPFKKQIDNLNLEIAKVEESIRKNKQSFKKKEIDDKVYAKNLQNFKKDINSIQNEIYKEYNTFFDEFSMIVPHNTRGEVIDILDGKKQL